MSCRVQGQGELSAEGGPARQGLEGTERTLPGLGLGGEAIPPGF